MMKKSVQESLKAITLKEMINLLRHSWNAVSATSIDKCWIMEIATGFPAPLEAVDDIRNQNSDNDDDESEGFIWSFDIDAAQRKIDASPDKGNCGFKRADNECPVFQHASDAEIINNVTGTSSGDTDTDDEICELPPKVAEAID